MHCTGSAARLSFARGVLSRAPAGGMTATSSISEMDINALLQPRAGFLWKLGGGQETGSKWNRRWFVLRDNLLMYFPSQKDYQGFRDKPSGVLLLDECNVRPRDEKAAAAGGRPYTFVISHTDSGEQVREFLLARWGVCARAGMRARRCEWWCGRVGARSRCPALALPAPTFRPSRARRRWCSLRIRSAS